MDSAKKQLSMVVAPIHDSAMEIATGIAPLDSAKKKLRVRGEKTEGAKSFDLLI